MKILYSSKFAREYKKLPPTVQDEAERRVALFRKNPFHPRLRTHKLAGNLMDFWSFSITYSYRIVFQFADDNTVWFHAVGDHSVYR